MGTKCAALYACLTFGYLEETKLFTTELPKYFNESECKLITEQLKRYMDDCFIFWPLKLNFDNFKTCLNKFAKQNYKFNLNKLNSRLKLLKLFMKMKRKYRF